MAQHVALKRCSILGYISAPILAIFEPKMGPKMAPKIAQKSVSAPKGRPEASREPLGTHFGAILASFWPPRGIIFKLFQACTSKLSKKPFEKAVRNHRSKGLSGHLHARAAEGHARWPVWARMRLLDPATEPSGSAEAVAERVG